MNKKYWIEEETIVKEMLDIERLPALASEYYSSSSSKATEDLTSNELQDELGVILAGTRDEKSNLHFLRGLEDSVLRKIYSYRTSEWASSVTLTLPAWYIERTRFGTYKRNGGNDKIDVPLVSQSPHHYVSFASCGQIEFPPPTSSQKRNVNMMPFVFGQRESLPPDLQCYFKCIQQCPYHYDEEGKIGYLTVHESYVHAKSAQRREDLHIEQPGLITDSKSTAFIPGDEHNWGGDLSFSSDEYQGGIFFASSAANTSAVYNALVDTAGTSSTLDEMKRGIVDRHGGCEHLRGLIGPSTKLEANELVWITDRTPHEEVVQEEAGFRQFFRVVTSNISHWFEAHSTRNPLVPLPDNIVVVKGDKFI